MTAGPVGGAGSEQRALGEVRDLLGPTGLLDVGALSDAALSSVAPSPVERGTWWAADPIAGGGSASALDVGAQPPAAGAAPHRLAAVRAVLHGATSAVTWTDDVRRGAFVSAGDVVLVDRVADGMHHLLLAERAVAVSLLAVGLDPLDVARHRVSTGARPRVVAADDVATSVPAATDRVSTVRLARVAMGPPPVETVVTFVGTGEGITAWRALPDGDVVVSAVDRDGIVGAALALLADEPSRGAA